MKLETRDEEIRMAISKMGAFKAPGKDDLSLAFYQKNWQIVGNDVCSLVKQAVTSGSIPKGINQTLVRLIPKVQAPEKVVGFRPISLINVSLKIITKVLVNRLQPLL